MDVWSTLANGSNLWDQESLSKISEARHWHWLSVAHRTNFLTQQVSDKRWLNASGMQRFGIGISRRVEAHEHLEARHQRHQGSARSAVQDEVIAFSVLISNSHSLHRSPHYISLSVYQCVHIYAYLSSLKEFNRRQVWGRSFFRKSKLLTKFDEQRTDEDVDLTLHLKGFRESYEDAPTEEPPPCPSVMLVYMHIQEANCIQWCHACWVQWVIHDSSSQG